MGTLGIEYCPSSIMRLLGKNKLQAFKAKYPDSRSSLNSWEAEVEAAEWKTPHELKQRYPRASIVGRNVIFDFGWNKYRLWALIAYKNATIFINKIGTHKEYDKWDIK